jgi:hypothetical protein
MAAGAEAGRWKRTGVKALLVASLLMNTGLATKIALFDPNVRIRPICWDDDRREFVAIDGQLAYRYMDSFNFSRSRRAFRKDVEENVYVPLIDYDVQDFWNYTTHVVDYLIKHHGDEMDLPPYETDGYGYVKVTCELVRAVAIEPSTDQ